MNYKRTLWLDELMTFERMNYMDFIDKLRDEDRQKVEQAKSWREIDGNDMHKNRFSALFAQLNTAFTTCYSHK